MGRLIVIEGLDGSGKSTQLSLLGESLSRRGIDCRTVSFPAYESDSSALVRMYLAGEFGQNPGDVNAFAASAFYAVDRFASYKTDWGEYYRGGGVVLSGRYTTSNAVHQCGKLPREQWKEFVSWLYDFEYSRLCIPKPDAVIFLDMPTDVSQKLLSERYSEGGQRDIHERDLDYLNRCREAALYNAEYSGWITVDCAENGAARSISDISAEINKIVEGILS